jgi:hypothetical protein
MTTLVVDSPDRISNETDGADVVKVDVEALTRVYAAPQACGHRGAACLYSFQCCPGLECYGAAPAHLVFGTCVT